MPESSELKVELHEEIVGDLNWSPPVINPRILSTFIRRFCPVDKDHSQRSRNNNQ